MTEPVIAQKSPYVIEESARRIAWCQCGLSTNQPYCDGSHKTTDIRPIIVDLAENKRVAWCGCKHSGKKPYCDGAHKRL